MADGLPTGTVTFLFTDIEGSTRLAERLGDRFQPVLEDHRAVIRSAVREGGGREVHTEGDSFFVAFSGAAHAVRAAVAAQRALAQHAWLDDAQLRVRMGIHTGEAATVGHDYVGLEVHRAARIAAAAHGGQILLSDATWTLVSGVLDDDIHVRDLGEHRLKDLSRPERIFQLVAPGLPTDFPPLRTLNAIPNNLPPQLTSFIGREDVVAEAKRLLAATRALTLTGPGGTGKTRLGLQLAADVLHEFGDGAYFVALGSISDSSLVAATIAQTLGLQQAANVSAVDALLDHLRDKRLLLVLDNFEQLVPAAPVVSQLLKGSPRVKAIVTSRSPLRISGEQEFPVPTLRVPPTDERGLPPLETLSHYEAVALFIERSVAVKPDFRVTNENAPAVAAICARLDGLPLAIELAAARIKLLTPQAMLARLEHGLGMLAAGGTDLPARQRTLRNTIAWSHDLLEPSAQRLFTRFGVFVGGARLDEIEAVCGPPDELGAEVLDGLAALVDQSLIRQGEEDAEPRFLMLETIREFALELLIESGQEELIRRRHAVTFLALAERAEPEMTGDRAREWLDRLERDHDNVRAAIVWAARAEPRVALRLAAAMWRFWQMRGFLNEARERLEAVLSLPGVDAHPRDLANAHEAAGGVAYWQGDFARSRFHYEACLALQREHGDEPDVANALYNLSFTRIVGLLGRVETEAGRAERDWALALLDECLAIYRRHADERGIAKALWGIGSVQYAFDTDASREAYQESLRLYRGLGDRFGIAWSLRELGALALRAGAFADARANLGDSLAHFAEARDVSGVTVLLNDVSRLEIAEGRAARGARIAGAAAALQASSGTDLASVINEVMGSGRGGAPDEATLAVEWQAGQGMGLDEAVAFALEHRPASERRARTGPAA